MNIQQKSRTKTIIVWRDSVAAGDDVFAPHEIKIEVENNESIETTLEKILATHYLPSIQGGKATWIVVGKNSLAVIAQQWSKPHFLVESVARIENLIEFTKDHHLEFMYWCQVEPNEVVASIEQGKPLPDKYGRDKK
jgi:hypothetical protein